MKLIVGKVPGSIPSSTQNKRKRKRAQDEIRFISLCISKSNSKLIKDSYIGSETLEKIVLKTVPSRHKQWEGPHGHREGGS